MLAAIHGLTGYWPRVVWAVYQGINTVWPAGFLPKGAFIKYATGNQILAALDGGKLVTGYTCCMQSLPRRVWPTRRRNSIEGRYYATTGMLIALNIAGGSISE